MTEIKPVLEYSLTAGYGGAAVLHEVSGCIQPGEIAALIGLSGSGKSTLAMALLRLLRYRGGQVSGSIRLNGHELMALPEREMRRVRGCGIGFVPQNAAVSLNSRLRVAAHLTEAWRAHSREKRSPDSFAGLLESVQLPAGNDFLDQRAGELSTGQGQRLLIALAIMHQPALLIADEPTSALDAITQAAVLRLFQNLNRSSGTAMLFISHDLLSVAAIADRVDILHQGRIVESGAPEGIFRAPVHSFTRELVGSLPVNPFRDVGV